MKIAICTPCHIPPTKEWIEKLEKERVSAISTLGVEADVIIVDDSNGHLGQLPVNWRLYDYPRQEEFLGMLYEQFATMFHKSSSCRIFGHILAYSEGYDVIIGLDSDCEVRPNFVLLHLENLKQKGCGWTNPLENIGDGKTKHYPRGFPYHMRDWKVVANMGLWEQTLDINGKDRVEGEPTTINLVQDEYNLAVTPMPFSGMNFALVRDAVPGFLFLPNFVYKYTSHSQSIVIKTDEFRRIDDIWGGYIFQKLMQKRRESATLGYPVVDHISKVIATEDAAEEAAMYKWEERFIAEVDMVMDHLDSPPQLSYIELYKIFLAKFLPEHMSSEKTERPFDAVLPAMGWWIKIWEKYGK